MNARQQETGAILKSWLREHKPYPIPSRPGKVNVQVDPEAGKRQIAEMVEDSKVSISKARELYNRSISHFEQTHQTDPSQLIDMADVNTILSLPAARQTRKFPRYIEHFYSAMDRPLVALYGAVVACCYQFGRIPDALFVNGGVLASIAEDTRILTGQKFDGMFRIFYPGAVDGKIKPFQIFTEAQLPFFILNHYNGVIPHDIVIAICEE